MDATPTATFIKNRGMEGWQLKRISEFPGCCQLGNSQSAHFDAYFVTPKLSALTGATDVDVETRTFRFAGAANIKLAILNAGKITGVDFVTMDGTTEAKKSLSADSNGTEFTITGELMPKLANNVVNKTYATITMHVSGATPETQIKFYVPEEEIASNSRIQFDYVKVTKK